MKTFSRFSLITSLVFVCVILFACNIPDSKAAENRANSFLETLRENDRKALHELAPFTRNLNEDQIAALMDGFPSHTRWNIHEVNINGFKALVVVEVIRSEIPQTISIPLKAAKGEWFVQNQISVSSTIEMIELEPDSDH